MSELAADYYDGRAASYGIGRPEILDGQPRILLDGDPAVSVRRPNPDHIAELAENLSRALAPAHDFVWAGLPPDQPGERQVTPSDIHENMRFLESVTDKLAPHGAATGTLRHLGMEAVAHAEIIPSTWNRFPSRRRICDSTGSSEATEAYFALTGLFKSGSVRKDVAALVIVRAVTCGFPADAGKLSVRYVGGRVPRQTIRSPLLAEASRPADAYRSGYQAPIGYIRAGSRPQSNRRP